ncbi:hypothetical protein AOQ84DRAFT_351746 [Glonium stellatum]|uniref:CHAT domain-containing protein n=1 Tax=Glonium stellatum TaxID=574774 RepID=A0A8E2FB69_9PEZI|nr:hypothetical protein AOQ84DRAFT_351746 [Glonium stellatum]
MEVLHLPSRSLVLEKLQGCSVVHFACHGQVDQKKPSQSALLLGTGANIESLAIDDIQSMSHQSAQIAYLSACSTAYFADRTLMNENIHLASAFQLAGFRHVVGTLWDTYDDAAIEVAGRFYKRLLLEKDDSINEVSRILHDAVLEYRNEEGNSEKILHWAPFLHIGP